MAGGFGKMKKKDQYGKGTNENPAKQDIQEPKDLMYNAFDSMLQGQENVVQQEADDLAEPAVMPSTSWKEVDDDETGDKPLGLRPPPSRSPRGATAPSTQGKPAREPSYEDFDLLLSGKRPKPSEQVESTTPPAVLKTPPRRSPTEDVTSAPPTKHKQAEVSYEEFSALLSGVASPAARRPGNESPNWPSRTSEDDSSGGVSDSAGLLPKPAFSSADSAQGYVTSLKVGSELADDMLDCLNDESGRHPLGQLEDVLIITTAPQGRAAPGWMDLVRDLGARLDKHAVSVVAVVGHQESENLRKIRKKLQVPFEILCDSSEEFLKTFGQKMSFVLERRTSTRWTVARMFHDVVPDGHFEELQDAVATVLRSGDLQPEYKEVGPLLSKPLQPPTSSNPNTKEEGPAQPPTLRTKPLHSTTGDPQGGYSDMTPAPAKPTMKDEELAPPPTLQAKPSHSSADSAFGYKVTVNAGDSVDEDTLQRLHDEAGEACIDETDQVVLITVGPQGRATAGWLRFLQDLSTRLDRQCGVSVAGVIAASEFSQLRKLSGRRGISFPILCDVDDIFLRRFGQKSSYLLQKDDGRSWTIQKSFTDVVLHGHVEELLTAVRHLRLLADDKLPLLASPPDRTVLGEADSSSFSETDSLESPNELEVQAADLSDSGLDAVQDERRILDEASGPPISQQQSVEHSLAGESGTASDWVLISKPPRPEATGEDTQRSRRRDRHRAAPARKTRRTKNKDPSEDEDTDMKQSGLVLNHSTHAPGVISFLRRLDKIARRSNIDISTIVPGRVSQARSRSRSGLLVRVTTEARGGWKLIAKAESSVQEVFIVTKESREVIIGLVMTAFKRNTKVSSSLDKDQVSSSEHGGSLSDSSRSQSEQGSEEE